MWPFGASKPRATERELDRALRDRVEELERRWKAVEVEWDEWYDKFRRLYARIAKRVEREGEAAPDAAESRQDAPQSTIPRAVGYDRPYIPSVHPKAGRRNY